MSAEFSDNGTAAVALVARRLVQLPDLDRRIDAALAGRQVSAALRVSNGRDGLPRRVEQIRLAQLFRVEQHHGASVERLVIIYMRTNLVCRGSRGRRHKVNGCDNFNFVFTDQKSDFFHSSEW